MGCDWFDCFHSSSWEQFLRRFSSVHSSRRGSAGLLLAGFRLGFGIACMIKLLGFSGEGCFLNHRKLKPHVRLCLAVSSDGTGTSA